MATHATRDVRRAQILNAAQECFGKHGYHKTKMIMSNTKVKSL